MKTVLLIFSLLFSLLLSQFVLAQGTSLLDQSAPVTGYGQIKFRAPVNPVGLDPQTQKPRYPILLVHGVYGGASHRTWRQLLPHLDAAGEAVYLVDLPGVGESDCPRRAYSLADLDLFLERFISEVVKSRTTVVAESIMGTSSLTVAGRRPDLIRRLILINPTGVNALNQAPSDREQKLYDRLYNDDAAGIAFYNNLLADNSLRYFLSFTFFNDQLIDENLLEDYRVARSNLEQRFISFSFVGGQLWRSFEEASRDVFIPVLAIFGAEYEGFNDNPPTKASEFAAIRPQFEYVEIPGSGSLSQREKPEAVAKEIIQFSLVD